MLGRVLCFFAFKTKRSKRSKIALIFQASPYRSSANRFLCGELMRAGTRGFLSWFNRSPASCFTCRGGTSVVPRVLAPIHRHRHKSPCARRPFAEIYGSISFSPPEFPFPETVPNFYGSLQGFTPRFPLDPGDLQGELVSDQRRSAASPVALSRYSR